MASSSLQIRIRLYEVKQEQKELLRLPLSGSSLANRRRNRLRVLNRIQVNLMNRWLDLIAEGEGEPDPSEQWKLGNEGFGRE